MAGIKSTKGEKLIRLQHTARLIGQGKRRYEIVAELTESYKISEAMADKYIGDVYQTVREESKDLAEHLLTQYDELYTLALLNKDRVLAKQIIDSKAKITVLKDKKVDITTNGKSLNLKDLFGFEDK